jgi:hypothetical protein
MSDIVKQTMLCPCCGGILTFGDGHCRCGARFVGHPLDQSPARVRRFGPVMTAATVFAAVVIATLAFTKWLAFASVIALWSARRAFRLTKSDPESFGGARAATVILTIAALSAAVSAGLGIAYIPRYLAAYEEKQAAATRASICHARVLIEEYRLAKDSYPLDYSAYREAAGVALPVDYWGNDIQYKSHAETAGGPVGVGFSFNKFELRSAGPDEKMGTADDIIMSDGVFISASEPPKAPVLSGAPNR